MSQIKSFIKTFCSSLPLFFYVALLIGSSFYTPPLLRRPQIGLITQTPIFFLEKASDMLFFGYYYHLGSVLAVTKGKDQADQAFARAGWYRPDFLPKFFGVDPHNYPEIAYLYEKFKLDELAKQLYLSWLANHSADITTYEQIRSFMIRTANWSEALNVIQQLLSLKPTDFYEYYYLGISYANLQQWDPAITAFEKCFTLKPDFADAYFQLGKIWETRADLHKAVNFYERTVELLPNHLEALQGLLRLRSRIE